MGLGEPERESDIAIRFVLGEGNEVGWVFVRVVGGLDGAMVSSLIKAGLGTSAGTRSVCKKSFHLPFSRRADVLRLVSTGLDEALHVRMWQTGLGHTVKGPHPTLLPHLTTKQGGYDRG